MLLGVRDELVDIRGVPSKLLTVFSNLRQCRAAFAWVLVLLR